MAKRKPKQVHPVVQKLFALRKRLGLSQREFASKFDFALATLRNWEQGASQPDKSTAALIALWLAARNKK